MTISKVLATAKNGKDDITVYESYEKYSVTPHYEIVISREGFATEVIKTARTTWRKKFNELTNE